MSDDRQPETIEKVAKAIWSTEFISEWGDTLFAEEMELCRKRALAAIEALK